ncbi:MAG: hypothetical protein CBC13_03290 [Planctomycetia bacterium TMED53]|nr:MAG: hypothetical protein CBC13_03290 [Planctomycetia bacterium TMED53]
MSGDAHQENTEGAAAAHEGGHGDGHDHGHGHSPFLAHHFDSLQQQFEAGKLGMWLFLATEVLLFGGLFCFYTVYKANHPDLFEWGHHFLDKRWGATNTMVLLFSSLTMAMAVREAQLGRKNRILFYLIVTFLCGMGFMGIKYIEYSKKFHEGLYPGKAFSYATVDGAEAERKKIEEESLMSLVDTSLPEAKAVTIKPKAKTAREKGPAVAPGGLAIEKPKLTEGEHPDDPNELFIDPSHLPPVERPENAHVFFSIYFCLTGLHGIHVLVGMGVMVWLMVLVMKNKVGSEFFTPVDLGGLYWHLVDLIWIYLFPLLYLVE